MIDSLANYDLPDDFTIAHLVNFLERNNHRALGIANDCYNGNEMAVGLELFTCGTGITSYVYECPNVRARLHSARRFVWVLRARFYDVPYR